MPKKSVKSTEQPQLMLMAELEAKYHTDEILSVSPDDLLPGLGVRQLDPSGVSKLVQQIKQFGGFDRSKMIIINKFDAPDAGGKVGRVIDGLHRLTACQEAMRAGILAAGFKIPCIVMKAMPSEDEFFFAVACNLNTVTIVENTLYQDITEMNKLIDLVREKLPVGKKGKQRIVMNYTHVTNFIRFGNPVVEKDAPAKRAFNSYRSENVVRELYYLADKLTPKSLDYIKNNTTQDDQPFSLYAVYKNPISSCREVDEDAKDKLFLPFLARIKSCHISLGGGKKSVPVEKAKALGANVPSAVAHADSIRRRFVDNDMAIPPALELALDKLVFTNEFDGELEANNGNVDAIPSIKKLLSPLERRMNLNLSHLKDKNVEIEPEEHPKADDAAVNQGNEKPQLQEQGKEIDVDMGQNEVAYDFRAPASPINEAERKDSEEELLEPVAKKRKTNHTAVVSLSEPTSEKTLKDFGIISLCMPFESFANSDLEKSLAKSIGLVLTDPPYGLNRGPHDILPDSSMKTLAGISRRILKEDGTGIVFCSWQQALAWFQCLSAEYFTVDTLQILLYKSTEKLYNKRNNGLSINLCEYFLKFHAKTTFHHNLEKNHCINSEYGPRTNILADYQYPRSEILKWPSAADVGKHKSLVCRPEQKKLSHLCELIKRFTKEGDWVIDFCGGSGSTAVAALMTRRRCIIIEKDAKLFPLMERRILAEANKLMSQGWARIWSAPDEAKPQDLVVKSFSSPLTLEEKRALSGCSGKEMVTKKAIEAGSILFEAEGVLLGPSDETPGTRLILQLQDTIEGRRYRFAVSNTCPAYYLAHGQGDKANCCLRIKDGVAEWVALSHIQEGQPLRSNCGISRRPQAGLDDVVDMVAGEVEVGGAQVEDIDDDPAVDDPAAADDSASAGDARHFVHDAVAVDAPPAVEAAAAGAPRSADARLVDDDDDDDHHAAAAVEIGVVAAASGGDAVNGAAPTRVVK